MSGQFEGRVAVVAGAEHPLAASLCRRIAGGGGRVVALGREHDALLEVAGFRPALIQTLTLGGMPHNVVDLLRGSWNGEPLDCFIDCMLLNVAGNAGASREVFALSLALTDALERGLTAAQGCATLVVPEGVSSDDKSYEAISYEAILNRFLSLPSPVRRMAVRVRKEPEAWSDAQCVSAGDVVLKPFGTGDAVNGDARKVDWTPEPS
ncbi:hypothetical protein [Sagittula stellata]|uniref:Uncharacterized protein n=1 Tax=Sagittula stellata (strain ATCC 700073 / DSM 11524 / E-37) TaxID=388399 RepID=A3K1V7_SAGS3|nr:hypothetical protein [Sagittula stellata]EBA08903.1 hypothetical protein SSE37_04635 [Sagittula stellata E-37]